MRIEEAAAKRQAKIDVGDEVIVGVNAYKTDDNEEVETLEIDNAVVKENQIKRLKSIKKNRDNKAVEVALNQLTKSAQSGEGNLLALSINAAKKRATLGEISDAMEKVFGRYKATIKTISGVYSSEAMKDKDFIKLHSEHIYQDTQLCHLDLVYLAGFHHHYLKF